MHRGRSSNILLRMSGAMFRRLGTYPPSSPFPLLFVTLLFTLSLPHPADARPLRQSPLTNPSATTSASDDVDADVIPRVTRSLGGHIRRGLRDLEAASAAEGGLGGHRMHRHRHRKIDMGGRAHSAFQRMTATSSLPTPTVSSLPNQPEERQGAQISRADETSVRSKGSQDPTTLTVLSIYSKLSAVKFPSQGFLSFP